ncbi:MAG: hypothetical protein RL885_28755, partial [Planctomycetota bacterium]
ANGASGGLNGLDLSADGRFITFESKASNLISGDRNNGFDVFVHNRRHGKTELVSVAADVSFPGNDESRHPAISANGRFVVFESKANNLVYEDSNSYSDIFLRDRIHRQTHLVSRVWPGDIGNNDSSLPDISGDGRWIVFQSFASNLVAGDTNGFSDIFLYDVSTRRITRISQAADGTQADRSSRQPSISDSGDWVVFTSQARNLLPTPATDEWEDVFLYDRINGTIERVSNNPAGGVPNERSRLATISADGRWIVYQSAASDIVSGDTNSKWDIFLYDRITKQTRRISTSEAGIEADDHSEHAHISADGRFVAFSSSATQLVPGDFNAAPDVFLEDVQTGALRRCSLDWKDQEAPGTSYFPRVSGQGREVAFTSDASNLADGDTNGTFDVFVRDSMELTLLGVPLVGFPVQFQLEHAFREEGQSLQVLLSLTGQGPWDLPGGSGLRLPLTPDSLTVAGLNLGSLFVGGIGIHAKALTPSLTIPQTLSNQRVYVAGVVFNPTNGVLREVTGPLTIDIQ